VKWPENILRRVSELSTMFEVCFDLAIADDYNIALTWWLLYLFVCHCRWNVLQRKEARMSGRPSRTC